MMMSILAIAVTMMKIKFLRANQKMEGLMERFTLLIAVVVEIGHMGGYILLIL